MDRLRLLLYCLIILAVPKVVRAGGYSRMDTRHFTFYYRPLDQIIVYRLIRVAETSRREINSDLGIEFQVKIKVYLANTKSEFQKLQPKGSQAPEWAGGIAYPTLNLMILNTSRNLKSSHGSIAKSFKHEYTHIALGRIFRWEQIPRWLNEGLAMYESREWEWERVYNISRAVLTDTLIPLDELTENFPEKDREAALAYNQSFYLISYLIAQRGRQTFHRFIREYGRGKNLDLVLKRIYRVNLAGLEEQWRKHLKLRFSWSSWIFSSTSLWFLTTLIFLVVYLIKREKSNKQLKEWEEEEMVLSGETQTLPKLGNRNNPKIQ